MPMKDPVTGQVVRPSGIRWAAVPVPAHPPESAGAVQQSVVKIEQDRLDLASARHGCEGPF